MDLFHSNVYKLPLGSSLYIWPLHSSQTMWKASVTICLQLRWSGFLCCPHSQIQALLSDPISYGLICPHTLSSPTYILYATVAQHHLASPNILSCYLIALYLSYQKPPSSLLDLSRGISGPSALEDFFETSCRIVSFVMAPTVS